MCMSNVTQNLPDESRHIEAMIALAGRENCQDASATLRVHEPAGFRPSPRDSQLQKLAFGQVIGKDRARVEQLRETGP